MNPVQPQKKVKHWSRISVDEIAFYYAKGCKVFPTLYTHYIDSLSQLEHQGKISLTPKTVLERYHLQLRRRITQRVHRIAKMISNC
jgi:hypothetical protein